MEGKWGLKTLHPKTHYPVQTYPKAACHDIKLSFFCTKKKRGGGGNQ